MPGQKERPLELSDFASELNREILANPYKFLGLPETASVADVRQIYIKTSRRYHPDMINPTFDSRELNAKYTAVDFASLEESIVKSLGVKQEDVFQEINEIVSAVENQDPREKERRAKALKVIQAAAHEKMVQLNTAYEAIKARSNPKYWNSPVGYEHVKQYNPHEKAFEQEIKLEANAELTLYPDSYEYWVPGAYLSYDWGPPEDHPWYDDEFRYATVVKHLFVHKELEEGRQQISRVLLDTFFKNFELNEAQQEVFTQLLVSQKTAEQIMEAMGIKSDHEIGSANFHEWYYPNRFRRHTNEMLTLSTEPTYHHSPIEMRWEEGKLILAEYTETIFSEADVMLLSTLAYGPMLTSG